MTKVHKIFAYDLPANHPHNVGAVQWESICRKGACVTVTHEPMRQVSRHVAKPNAMPFVVRHFTGAHYWGKLFASASPDKAHKSAQGFASMYARHAAANAKRTTGSAK